MVNYLTKQDFYIGFQHDQYNLTSNPHLNSVHPYLIVYCMCLFFTIITGIIVNIIVIAAYKYGYKKNAQRSNSILVHNKSRNFNLKNNHLETNYSPFYNLSNSVGKTNVERRVSVAVTSLESNYKDSKMDKISNLTLDEAKTNFNQTSKQK